MSGQLSVADVRAAFPEITESAHTDAEITAAIGTARSMAAATKEIWLHCTAHLLTLPREGRVDGGAGEITSARLGPQQTAYREMAEENRDVFFTGTPYGRILLTLEKRSVNSRFSIHFG